MRTFPRIEATRALRVAVPLCLVALLCGLLASGASAARKGGVKQPKAGKYAGKVGTFARIIFNVNGRKRAIVNFNAGVKTNCQRASDGFITETKNLATAPGEQEPPARLRMKRQGKRWAFEGTARDREGVEWKVAGLFVSRVKARGMFEASKFETLFNPFLPFGIDSQLCAGSGEWTAVRQGGKKRRRARG